MADNGESKNEVQQSEGPWYIQFMNPVVAIAGVILLGVLFLLFCAIFGIDKGVLVGMARPEYARGLITYLFAVVTIGTAVLLVVSALVSKADERHEKQFQRGKEVLSLLLGVFGTIVGFYFGSEVSSKAGKEEILQVAPIHLSSSEVAPGANFTLETTVTGGQPPYRFSAAIDRVPLDVKDEAGQNGAIKTTLPAPPLTEEKTVTIELRAEDAHGHTALGSAKITVKLPPH